MHTYIFVPDYKATDFQMQTLLLFQLKKKKKKKKKTPPTTKKTPKLLEKWLLILKLQ